jgi:hypothetical protein
MGDSGRLIRSNETRLNPGQIGQAHCNQSATVINRNGECFSSWPFSPFPWRYGPPPVRASGRRHGVDCIIERTMRAEPLPDAELIAFGVEHDRPTRSVALALLNYLSAQSDEPLDLVLRVP